MMDNADNLLSSVVGQLSERNSLQDTLSQQGPLPVDHLQPDTEIEISLDCDTSETDLPTTRDLKRRNTLIHELSYSNEPINRCCVLDVEASFSYHHVDLREICILDYDTGNPLFHQTWKQPVSFNFISGDHSGMSLEELQKLQDHLVSLLNNNTIIGHNVEYDFDVLDRLASFKSRNSYYPEHLRIFLKPTSLIDTRYISWLLLPCNSEHPLEELHSRLCPVPSTTEWHRAKFDSKATLEIILSFIHKFNCQDLEGFDLLSEAVHGLDIRHPLKRLLNINTGREVVLFDSSKVPFDHSILPKDGSENIRDKESIDAERAEFHLDRMLNNNSYKSSIYDGQKSFIKKALEGIHHNKRIAIESGTGTGKTFAYLASALEAVRCGNKAIVATPTLNLQEQVWNSALELHTYFKNEGFDFRLAQIIGSANFLSVQKIFNQSKSMRFDHPADSFLCVYLQLRLYRFHSSEDPSEEPDRYIQDYLSLGNSANLPSGLLKMLRTAGLTLNKFLCRANENTYGSGLNRIHFPRISFLQQNVGDLLIENQSLFFRKRLLKDSPEQITPLDQEVIVIDEAHTLLEEGTSALTQTLSCINLAEDFYETESLKSIKVPKSAIHIRDNLRKSLVEIAPVIKEKIGVMTKCFRRTLQNYGNASQDDIFQTHNDLEPFNSVSYRNIPIDGRNNKHWTDLIKCFEDLFGVVVGLIKHLKVASDSLGSLVDKQKEDSELTEVEYSNNLSDRKADQDLKIAIDDIKRQVECWSEHKSVCELAHQFSQSYSQDGLFNNDWVFSLRDEEPPCPIEEYPAGEGHFKWAQLIDQKHKTVLLWKARKGKTKTQFPPQLEIAPLWPGKFLKKIWDQAASVVFTSGTLRVSGQFNAWKEWSGFGPIDPSDPDRDRYDESIIQGLDPMKRIKVWRNSSLFFDAHSDPQSQNKQIALEAARANLALGPKTLTLFTSREALGKTAEILRGNSHSQEMGLSILAQEPGGLSRNELAEKFTEQAEPSILLGTRSFWQGIDLPGAIDHLVIPRLPFSNIGDPIVSARMESCEMEEDPSSGFEKYLLPQMLQQLRQGLGRGIRKVSDRCTVHILDSRASWSSYTHMIDLLLMPDNEVSSENQSNHLQYTGLSKAESYLLAKAAFSNADVDGNWADPPGPVRFKSESEHIKNLKRLDHSTDVDSQISIGFHSFSGVPSAYDPKAHQKDAILKMLDHRDREEIIAVIRATGGGKSAIYKTVAGLERNSGISVVISPLISLMTDQAQKLRSGSEGIRSLDSIMHSSRRSAICEEIADPAQGVNLLLTSVERLSNPELMSALIDRGVARVVIDEAHLLNTWGTDFRPLYRHIPKIVQSMESALGQRIPVTLFSATLTTEDLKDAERLFGRKVIENWDPAPDPSYRKNLVPHVEYPIDKPLTNPTLSRLWQFDTLKEEIRADLNQEQHHQVLVFVRTKKIAVLTALALQKMLPQYASKILPYFSDIPERTKIDRAFNEQKNLRVLVSTSAFGMGVDNPDILSVYHLELPLSLTDYVQECGRAARHPQPQFPGKHTLVFPGPVSATNSLSKNTLSSLTKSSEFLSKKSAERWEKFISEEKPDVSRSRLIDPIDPQNFNHKTLTQKYLVQAENSGLGTYLGHIPFRLSLPSPLPEKTNELLRLEKGYWIWKEGICPNDAWNFMLEYRRGIRNRKYPTPKGDGSSNYLIAWKTRNNGQQPPNFTEGSTTNHLTSGEAFGFNGCLRKSLYQPFTACDTLAPTCPLDQTDYQCTICENEQQGWPFIDSEPDQRNFGDQEWILLAQNTFGLEFAPQKVEIEFIRPKTKDSVSQERCSTYMGQKAYRDMLNYWLFGGLKWERNS